MVDLSKIKLDLRFRTIIPPLVYKARHARNPQEIRAAELDILHALLNIETVMKYIKEEVLKTEKQGGDAHSYKAKLYSLQYLRKIVKLIGSIFPWSYLTSYEISALSSNPPPGFIVGKEGFKAEFQLFREGFKRGDIVILNDLTHCLTVADAVIIHKDDSAELAEVKSGKSSRLRHPQRKRMTKAVRYMHEGVGEFKGKPTMLTKSYHFVTYNWNALNRILKDAKKTGFAVSHPEPSLTYVALKPRHQKVEELLTKFLQTDPVITKYKPVVATSVGGLIEISEQNRRPAPVTVFKIKDKALIDLLDGELDVITFFSPFNPTTSKRFSKNGLSLSLIREDKLTGSERSEWWLPLTEDHEGVKMYLACKYNNSEKHFLVDHAALKLMYTFETEASFLNSLVQNVSDIQKYYPSLFISGKIEGSKGAELDKQDLRSWVSKLARPKQLE